MSVTILEACIEQFPISGTFTIARGSKTLAEIIRVTLTRDGRSGQGECVPYARYGETPKDTLATILNLKEQVSQGLTREGLQSALPASAARNAIDCAFWDLEAKLAGTSVAQLAGLSMPEKVCTAYTISLGGPEDMAEAARNAAGFELLKLKLSGDGDIARIKAVRAAVPKSRLIVDANEAWREDNLLPNLNACADHGIELVEQPLPAKNDQALATIARPVPVCADESAHDRAGLANLRNRYDSINIKLDKTGGLTEAIALTRLAKTNGFRIMVGCMVSTSLSMAPALQLASLADWVDLDGPLLLQNDRTGGFNYHNGLISPTRADIWG